MYKKFFYLLLTFFCVFTFAQSTISVPFNVGFIGNYTGTNQATSVYRLSSLGIQNVRFTQVSSTGQFTAQGNDVPGNLILVDNNGVQHVIEGLANWRMTTNGNTVALGFIPAINTNLSIATNGVNTSSTYTIKGSNVASPYTTIGLIFNNSTLTFNNGDSISGNAAAGSVLTALNSYLTALSLHYL